MLIQKMRAMGPDCKSAVLVSINGVTGDSYKDAMLKIREARQDGRYIIVLEAGDLHAIADGTSFSEIIERRYEQTLLI